jgi:hypothetical protein
MTAIDTARRVMATRQAHLIRPRKGARGQYDSRRAGHATVKGWTCLDLPTASAMVSLYETLEPHARATYEHMRIEFMASVATQAKQIRG